MSKIDEMRRLAAAGLPISAFSTPQVDTGAAPQVCEAGAPAPLLSDAALPQGAQSVGLLPGARLRCEDNLKKLLLGQETDLLKCLDRERLGEHFSALNRRVPPASRRCSYAPKRLCPSSGLQGGQ
jgi:hypothetical protein